MPAGQRPLVRRRLRLELRQERERAGKSQSDVAKRMDWSLSKIIRLEAGQVGISTNDLRALLDMYQVNESERRTFLIELARAARQSGAWWAAYRDVAASSDYLDFLGYENDASDLYYYSPLIVPGLLQTEEYAREILTALSLNANEELTERAVQLRMSRKRHVLDRDNPPSLTAVIDESALRHVVGGDEVMNDQLTSVAEVAALDNVTVRVIPFSHGAHPGLSGAFEILDFADPMDTPVLQFDAAPRDVTLRENGEALDFYRRCYRQLLESSLPEAESIELINNIAEGMLGGES